MALAKEDVNNVENMKASVRRVEISSNPISSTIYSGLTWRTEDKHGIVPF